MPTYLNVPTHLQSFSQAVPQAVSCIDVYNHVKDCPVCTQTYDLKEKFTNTTSATTRPQDRWPLAFNEIYISPAFLLSLVTFILLIIFMWSKR